MEIASLAGLTSLTSGRGKEFLHFSPLAASNAHVIIAQEVLEVYMHELENGSQVSLNTLPSQNTTTVTIMTMYKRIMDLIEKIRKHSMTK